MRLINTRFLTRRQQQSANHDSRRINALLPRSSPAMSKACAQPATANANGLPPVASSSGVQVKRILKFGFYLNVLAAGHALDHSGLYLVD